MSSFWKHLIITTIAIGLLIITAQWAARAETSGVIVIDFDGGGNVADHLKWWTRIKNAHIPVRFRGMCVSACTLGLMLPLEQMCAEHTASFGFHLASDEDGADPEFTKALILRYYPQAVQEWLKGKKLTVNRILFMSADEAIKLGVLPACDSPAIIQRKSLEQD
jgi:hypothetical protein